MLYMRSLNHIPKVLIPCSKGGLQCAAEAQCDLQSSVTEPTAALPFQDKGVRDDFDPNLLLANIKSEEGMPQNLPRRSLWDSHKRTEQFGSFPNFYEILISYGFSLAIPLA